MGNREIIKQRSSYRDMAGAIVVQAARDYRRALQMLKKNPKNEKAQMTKDEVERFFFSEWYQVLCEVEPTVVIREIRREVDYEGCKRIS